MFQNEMFAKWLKMMNSVLRLCLSLVISDNVRRW